MLTYGAFTHDHIFMRITILLVFVVSLLGTESVLGAKRPNQLNKKISIKNALFEFNDIETSWWRAPVPASKKGVSVLFRAPLTEQKDFQPIMTVRVGKTGQSINNYVASWMGDYSKLGYDILGSRPFKHQNHRAYVVDVRNAATEKQARQVIFLKDNNTVILTCIDRVKTFKNSLSECNKIVKSFSWTTI